jgi:hypothetical protein
MNRKQDDDAVSPVTPAQARSKVTACQERIRACELALSGQATLVANMAERLVLDGFGITEDLTIVARNYRRLKASRIYADEALGQARAELDEARSRCLHDVGTDFDGKCLACGATA